ncbi:uncharacterized protein BX664DRAFT_356481 [Halteromyces radiatus]|uniref:uncharacterized protein n=1 Tax=Halteromyces radiatus TaxID=101107 RepID=UPI00221EBD8C|nr:uncharacterized protein BX664DRAFT_356481 [Halteromyces radiatus]KAI8097221.1 hypothetical protein BX664DRAFT_356481 [Halteromyces radiatus]
MDHDSNTTKNTVYENKNKSRRWSNCFGLVNKFKRLKNRLSVIHSDTTSLSIQQHGYQRKSTPPPPLRHVYQQEQQLSASTIATPSPHLSSLESIEQNNLSTLTNNNLRPSLSPPPRHNKSIGKDRAIGDTAGNCLNDWRQFTSSYQKMNLRLSLDTEFIHHRQINTTSNISDSPIDIVSVRDSMITYQEDDASTLRANSSTISYNSSMIPLAPSSVPFRSGTLGHPKSLKNQSAGLLPPLPSVPVSGQPSSSSSSSSFSSSSCRLSMDSDSRSSSIDLPLKERRRRRSPLMFGDNDRLTLPIPRNDIIQQRRLPDKNHHRSPPPPSSSSSSLSKLPGIDSTTIHNDIKLRSREMAMQQLEGTQPLDGKIVSMPRIASTKLLDEQLIAAGDPTLLINKAQYDAVVSRTIQQRRPSSSLGQHVPLLTPSTANTIPSSSPPLTSSSPGAGSNKITGNSNITPSTTYPSFLPTPSTSSSNHHTSNLFYFPSTPNSMDAYT